MRVVYFLGWEWKVRVRFTQSWELITHFQGSWEVYDLPDWQGITSHSKLLESFRKVLYVGDVSLFPFRLQSRHSWSQWWRKCNSTPADENRSSRWWRWRSRQYDDKSGNLHVFDQIAVLQQLWGDGYAIETGRYDEIWPTDWLRIIFIFVNKKFLFFGVLGDDLLFWTNENPNFAYK